MVPPEIPMTAPHSRSCRDYVTAHKISLLVLIKTFCDVRKKSLVRRSNQKPEENSYDHTNQQTRDFASTMLKLIQNPDMDLKRLINIIHPIMHPKTYQDFIDNLQKLRKNGVREIMDFIATLDSLLVDLAPNHPVIQKSSVLGLFIRHMLLAFDKLSFSLVTKLCRKFHVYYDAAFGQCLDDSVEVSSNDSPLDEKLDDSYYEEFQVLASQKQAEFFIAQQAALLQINESAALSPFELQQKIKELMKGNQELYEACYLSYLNSLRVKEYSGARDNLYHHFDRNTTVPQECKSSSASEDLSRSSRYAALNLAMLHALFGHKDEAIAALNEAIMVAQEVNDNICLQYSLAWLYRLTEENKEVLIERSITKSSELGLWYLSSLGMQAMTKRKSCATTQPACIFDLLTRSDIQNCQHSMTDLLGPAYTLRAGLWAYYGHSMMMNLSSQMLLYLNTADPVHGGVYHIGEGACLALRNMAMYYASEGMYVASAQVLALARDLFPPHSEHSHIWQLADLVIKFEKSLYHGKWLKAQKMQKGIGIFDKDEAMFRKAQLLFNQGNLAEANDILKKMIDGFEDPYLFSPHYLVRTLLLRVEILCATPNYTVALPSLMRCLGKCKAHHLLHLQSLTTLQIAAVQLELGLPKQALHMLDEVFIAVLTHGACYDKGCCCYLYARCLAFIAMQNKDEFDKKSTKDILSAIDMSQKALEYFRKVKALKKMKLVLCWQAHLYNHLGMTTERNNAAYTFRNLEDELA